MKPGAPDWELIRRQFPVANNYIYFNHAAIAPMSVNVKERITACMQKYCDYGIVCNQEFLRTVEHTRKLAGRLIDAEPSQIAFVKNTTQGLLLAANGIRWQKGDNVVVPEREFPANIFPWLNLVKKGVEVKFVPLRDGRFTGEDIARTIDKNTRAVSVSAVSFVNGFRCNLQEIGRLCKDHGILFIVDAIQALGALELAVSEGYIDLLAADSHKWLLGPQGIGFAYVSRFAMDRLDVANLGWMSMEDEGDYLRYDIRLKSNAARFEEGTLNIFGVVGLETSLEMLLSIGTSDIQKRIMEITDLLVGGLSERGYTIQSSLKSNERSGILSFTHVEHAAEDIYRRLFEANVVCAQRNGVVRISPHFYNNASDVDGFLNALI